MTDIRGSGGNRRLVDGLLRGTLPIEVRRFMHEFDTTWALCVLFGSTGTNRLVRVGSHFGGGRATVGVQDKPQLVFVHGIGGPRDVERERRDWLVALAEGFRAAGHASAISGVTAGWSVDTVFIGYADLFVSGGQPQGGAGRSEDDEAARLALEFAVAVIDSLLVAPEFAEQRAALLRVRAQAAPTGTAQGLLAPTRVVATVASSLARIPGVRFGVQRASGSRLLFGLSQPGRYLRRKERIPSADGSEQTLDARIRARVLHALDPRRPAIVVGHSLGSVVALEALAEYPGRVALFVTVGSPIALDTLVWPRLRPRPPAVPETVECWLDLWDGDDPVVPTRQLADLIAPNSRGITVDPVALRSRLLWTHPATVYLRRPEVAGPVAEVVTRLSAP